MKKSIPYIETAQKRIIGIVTGEFKNYYLTGGTALNLYFNHRSSKDLDFFAQRYRKEEPDKIMKYLSGKTGYQFKLEAEQDDPKLIPMKIYFIELKKGYVLKIDFVLVWKFKKLHHRHSMNDVNKKGYPSTPTGTSSSWGSSSGQRRSVER